MHPLHGPPPGHPQTNGHTQLQQSQPKNASQYLTQANEAMWLQLGQVSELMGELDSAILSYEHAMLFNQWSVPAMQAISGILRTKDQFPAAVEYLKQIIKVESSNGDVWSSLGHCYLMMDDLQQAYSAYQQALYHLQDPKEPKLWYGIGILYDRYGSLEHAEEAFSQVMRMDPHFEKANEIYFRLGIIYKQQSKYQQSLECFKYIVTDPPRPLTEEDIWFQIGHVHEQQKDYDSAKNAYQRVIDRDPNHAKVLQQLGWLYHQQSTSFSSQEQAIVYLEKSVASDQTDAQSLYLLGRCYMSQQKYPNAYEAYQQAVYRDGRNPTFWCSIGVLYYQINQYRDALDAYSRAIRLNPNISEVWYDLGTLYESCNNQTNDALDAYQRAADLDPANVHIKARLALLRGQPAGVSTQASAPLPQDVHPQAYQSSLNGPPGPQWGPPGPSQPQGPPPPALATGNDWNRRLADMQNPPMQPQPHNPYDQRDGMRPHQPPARLTSPPRQEPMRQFQEPQRPLPPAHRGLSPSPKVHHAASTSYQGPQGPQSLPQPAAQQSQLPPHQQQQQQQQPNRITNPNYGGQPANGPPPPANVTNGPSGQGPMPPYTRVNSPPPEVRPIIDSQAASPSNNFSRQPYQHHPNPNAPGGIASGAPAPASALAAAEAAARQRDERTPTAPPKRHREWEDDNNSVSSKKPANDENRARLEDRHSRRPSPPDARMASPPRRSPSAMRRAEDQRRADENYHPSEAAHHLPSLPSVQHITHPSPRMSQPPQKEERREQYEPAARKMDVDEDYDDSGDDDKRSAPKSKSEKNSPRGANGNGTNGMAAHAQPKVEPQP